MAEAPPIPSYADETYTREAARYEHQLNTTLAGDKETLGNLNSSYAYNNSLLTQQEPLRYAANSYKGVNEGIAQSGIQAGRRGQIGANFLNQRTKLTTGLQEAKGRLARSEQGSREDYNEKIATQIRAAEERAKNKLVASEPQAEPTYPIPPAQAAAIKAGVPAGPGGVVPYESAKVRVGPRPAKPAPPPAKYIPGGGFRNPAATRIAAVRKAARR